MSPRRQVQKLWEKLVDRLAEAHMNAVELYVPWDFHEPVEGTFDFDGTLDQDHDGKPDYPSRNLTRLFPCSYHGVSADPDPSWPLYQCRMGTDGFWCRPLWFLDHYPKPWPARDTGKSPHGVFPPPHLSGTCGSMVPGALQQVLKDFIGPGKPVVLLQLDNETNYFWDSVYERDRSAFALERYRHFLRDTYADSSNA